MVKSSKGQNRSPDMPYGADLEKWLKHSKAFNYADDTQTDCKGKTKEEVMSKLKEDAENVLQFMASNGLVANAGKTVLMFLRESNFCIDGANLWNKAPQEIRESTTLNETKRLVKIYVCMCMYVCISIS